MKKNNIMKRHAHRARNTDGLTCRHRSMHADTISHLAGSPLERPVSQCGQQHSSLNAKLLGDNTRLSCPVELPSILNNTK